MPISKKLAPILLTAGALTVATIDASATSYLPAAAATSLTTDIKDTAEATFSWIWTIFPVIALGWFAFNQARKGAGKFGAK